jgi:hypothetical protein
MKVSSNSELHEYLALLVSRPERVGAETLSKDVSTAARTVGVVPVTEFIGESRIALRRVLDQENGSLSKAERAEVQDVLSQLNAAF